FGRQIFVACERDALALAGVMADHRFTILVARGRDGDWASTALAAMGCVVVRGSSLHDPAAALAALARRLDDSPGPAAIVADGPLGPHRAIRRGAFYCAMRT